MGQQQKIIKLQQSQNYSKNVIVLWLGISSWISHYVLHYQKFIYNLYIKQYFNINYNTKHILQTKQIEQKYTRKKLLKWTFWRELPRFKSWNLVCMSLVWISTNLALGFGNICLYDGPKKLKYLTRPLFRVSQRDLLE